MSAKGKQKSTVYFCSDCFMVVFTCTFMCMYTNSLEFWNERNVLQSPQKCSCSRLLFFFSILKLHDSETSLYNFTGNLLIQNLKNVSVKLHSQQAKAEVASLPLSQRFKTHFRPNKSKFRKKIDMKRIFNVQRNTKRKWPFMTVFQNHRQYKDTRNQIRFLCTEQN